MGLNIAIGEYLNETNNRMMVFNSLNNLRTEIKDLLKIMKTMNKESGVSHRELAYELNISEDNLEIIMGKLLYTGAVSMARPGPISYYYLTSFGKEFCEYYK